MSITWRETWLHIPRPVRIVIVVLVGGTLLLAGIVMLVTPGPGWPMIYLGLAVLAAEFAWAALWLARARKAAAGGYRFVRKSLGWEPRKKSELESEQQSSAPKQRRSAADPSTDTLNANLRARDLLPPP